MTGRNQGTLDIPRWAEAGDQLTTWTQLLQGPRCIFFLHDLWMRDWSLYCCVGTGTKQIVIFHTFTPLWLERMEVCLWDFNIYIAAILVPAKLFHECQISTLGQFTFCKKQFPPSECSAKSSFCHQREGSFFDQAFYHCPQELHWKLDHKVGGAALRTTNSATAQKTDKCWATNKKHSWSLV